MTPSQARRIRAGILIARRPGSRYRDRDAAQLGGLSWHAYQETLRRRMERRRRFPLIPTPPQGPAARSGISRP